LIGTSNKWKPLESLTDFQQEINVQTETTECRVAKHPPYGSRSTSKKQTSKEKIYKEGQTQ